MRGVLPPGGASSELPYAALRAALACGPAASLAAASLAVLSAAGGVFYEEPRDEGPRDAWGRAFASSGQHEVPGWVLDADEKPRKAWGGVLALLGEREAPGQAPDAEPREAWALVPLVSVSAGARTSPCTDWGCRRCTCMHASAVH